MKNKRKLVLLIVILSACVIFAVLFLLGAINDSKKQKEINSANIKGAKANAVKYIKEKYGFEATVKTAVLERMPPRNPLTTVLLEMEYQDKIFNVYIDGSYDNTAGMDNYQADEIKSALKELGDNTVSGVCDVWIASGNDAHASKGDISIWAENMFSDYYDGTNLFEIISKYSTKIVFKYIQTDVYKNEDWSVWDDLIKNNDEMSVKFISYRSQKELEKGIIGTEEKYAVYIDGYASLYSESQDIDESLTAYAVETKNYVLYETNGFYYYIKGNENADVKVTETEPYDLSLWDSDKVNKVVSPAFFVEADRECEIYIFYPVSAIYEYNTYDTYSAVCYPDNGKTKYDAFYESPVDAIGGEYSMVKSRMEGKEDFLYFMYTQRSDKLKRILRYLHR